ncbi:MAG: 2-oxo acid dehydrogenase subunit E2, partial [Ignavibacteria bacterium]
MLKEVKLPEVSDNVETGDVVKVLVSVGDQVKVDQPVIELETDKAMFEVPSTEEGVVKEIMVKVGDAVSIGSVILTLDSGANGVSKDENTSQSKSDSKPQGETEKNNSKNKDEKKSEIKADDKNSKNSDKEEFKKEDKKPEENPDKKVEKEEDNKSESVDEVKEMSEEKNEAEPEESGSKDEKENLKKDTDEKEQEKVKTNNSEDAKGKKDKIESSSGDREVAAASPSVRRLARELGVDINTVNGSGSDNRISETDLKKFVKEKINNTAVSGVSEVQKGLPDFEKWGDVEKEPMSKVRVITGEAMTHAWTTIPMVTQFDKADITKVEEFRKKYADKVKEEGGHLTVTSILVKICTAALKKFPQFNASIDFANKEIIYKKYYNIGVAVDTDRG